MPLQGGDVTPTVGRADPWTPFAPVRTTARWSERRIERLTGDRWWAWKATVLAMVVGMFFAAPPFGGFAPANSYLWRYTYANSGPQLFDPHVDLSAQTGNLTFRIVPRLIGAALGLDSQPGFLAVQLVFGILLLWAVAHLYEEALDSRVLATLLTVATACTWAGATAWLETRGLFDAVGLSFLALAMRTRRVPLVVVFALAASFSDERALIALPLVLCWHALRPQPRHQPDPPTSEVVVADHHRPRWFALGPAAVVAAIGLHVVIRTWLKHRYGLSEGHNRYPADPFVQLRNYPNGVWGAFEGLWLLIGAGLATWIHRRRWWVAAAVVAALAPPLLVGMSVVDVSRAIAFAWPAAPVVALGLRGVPRRAVRQLVWATTFVSVGWPMVYAAGDQTVDWFYPAPLLIVHAITGGVR